MHYIHIISGGTAAPAPCRQKAKVVYTYICIYIYIYIYIYTHTHHTHIYLSLGYYQFGGDGGACPVPPEGRQQPGRLGAARRWQPDIV